MNQARSIRIIPTCVPDSADDVRAAIEKIRAFTDAIHLDINDGILAAPYSWPYTGAGKQGSEALDIPVDNFLIQIHLMVSEGREIGEFFINAGAPGVHSIVAHVESLDTTAETISAWRVLGASEIGLAILLDTPIEKLDSLLPYCDFIHIMSVATIGAQGAPFDAHAIDRVRELRSRVPDLPIAVDGGVSLDNIASLVEAGATRFSIGSAIMHAADPSGAYAAIKTAAELSTKV